MTLLYLAIAYLLGIALGRLCWDLAWFGCAFPNWLWLGPLVLLPLSPLVNRLPIWPRKRALPMRWPVWAGFEIPQTGPSPAWVAAFLLALCTGTLRYAATPLTPCWTPADLAYYNLPADRAFDRAAPEVTITGYISSYPLVSDTKQRLHVVAHSVMATADATPQPVAGALRLTTGTRQRYQYGQPVRLRGRLVTPPDFEDFSYREYLARKQIHSLLYNAQIELLPGEFQGRWLDSTLYAFRARGERLLNRLLPEPYAALANGMLLGIEAGIPDALYEQFNLTGTSHTIVISGSNISILAGVLLALGQRLFGRRRALWPTLVGIGCYALLVGGDAAVLRAAFMGGLFVTATAINRRSTALVSLAVACWAMTLINPLTLWDVGFQLSSAATAGLILFTPGITATVNRLWPAMNGGILTAVDSLPATQRIQTIFYGLIQDGLLVTVAANITTLPLVVYYFHRLSVVSLMANLLVAPVQPFIMLWGSLGILVGVVGLPWLAWLILLVPWLSLIWTVATVQWTAALPGASVDIASYEGGWLLLTYLLIGLIHWRMPLLEQLRKCLQPQANGWATRLVGSGAVGVLSVGGILIWATLLSQPDGRLHVYFLDIGQGDGIFIQTPSGRQVLIDGGASPQTLMSELGAVMPFWDRAIDLLVLTHPDGDHMNAQIEVP
ncbi:MAG: ComEC/Rec2 family competence protein, partial [Caldilineaceae bacterium]|nr:ComEC/Rec2 family competence protein [Caldilineaceae bacterium]